jgi:hypothetical protein
MTATAETIDPSVEEQIAAVLKSPAGVTSVTFALMLQWTNAKISLTKQAAQEALQASLDPSVIDPGALGRAHDLEHFLQRLENAKEALTPLAQAAARREELEKWKTDTAALKQRVTDLSQKLLSVYADVTGKLVELFGRCDAADREVSQINHAAPGVLHCLHGVEATLTNGRGTKIIPKVKLPALTLDGREAPDVWPPRTVPISVTLSAHVGAMMGAGRAMTEEERVMESARHVADGERRERVSEQMRSDAAARAMTNESDRRRLAAGG